MLHEKTAYQIMPIAKAIRGPIPRIQQQPGIFGAASREHEALGTDVEAIAIQATDRDPLRSAWYRRWLTIFITLACR